MVAFDKARRCDRCSELFPPEVMHPVKVITNKKQVNAFDDDTVYICPCCLENRVSVSGELLKKVKK